MPGETSAFSASVYPENTDPSVSISIEAVTSAAYKDGVITAACEGLTAVCVSASNGLKAWCIVNVVNPFENADVVLPNSLTEIKESAFMNLPVSVVLCSDRLSSVGENAFKGCKKLMFILSPKA